MGIIFVAGVHGVGKTSSCNHVSDLIGQPLYTASAIIRAEKATLLSDQSKQVRDVNENQDILVQGVYKLFSESVERFLLDGHFTLINTQGHIESIGIDIFSRINLDGVVIFQDAPKKLCQRLYERDEKSCSVSEVTAHQDAELNQAQFVAEKLDVPIFQLEAFDYLGLADATSTIWNLA